MNTKHTAESVEMENNASEGAEFRPEIVVEAPFQLDAHLNRLLGEVRSSH